MLRTKGLKISGKKAELIDRVLDNFSEDEIRLSGKYHEVLVISDQGREAIKQFEIDDEKEELELFKDACRLFATGEEPENQEILEYLKQSSSYDKILEALPDLRCQLSAVPDNILACGIYCWLTGKSTRRVSALYIETFKDNIDEDDLRGQIHYVHSYISNYFSLMD